MSTSEYENQNHKEWDNLFPSTLEPALPDDFSEEDVVFAQELSTLFSPSDEILPPYYAQTLLQAEDPRYTVVEKDFVQKTSVRVFRALKLRRRLFPRRHSLLVAMGQRLHDIIASKSFVAWAASLMLIMMMTMAFTAPSFEKGMALLLHNSRNGVLKVHKAPPVQRNAADIMFDKHSYNTRPTQIPLLTAERMLSFPVYWPQWIPANYTLDSIRIYEYSNDTWADGPFVDLVYDVDVSHFAPKGTGQIVVREFLPVEQVLQVVQDGHAFPVDPDQYGENPRAIYVDGQWVIPDKSSRVWQNGWRSEIIYQKDNVVFWIAGDQRDGIKEEALWKMAQSLQTTSSSMTSLFLKNINATIVLPNSLDAATNPFATDIVYAVSPDGSDGQFYMTMSAYVSGKLASSKLLSHGH